MISMALLTALAGSVQAQVNTPAQSQAQAKAQAKPTIYKYETVYATLTSSGGCGHNCCRLASNLRNRTFRNTGSYQAYWPSKLKRTRNTCPHFGRVLMELTPRELPIFNTVAKLICLCLWVSNCPTN